MVRTFVTIFLIYTVCVSCRPRQVSSSVLESSDSDKWWKKSYWTKQVPKGYSDMEIEAKWTLKDADDFQKLVKYFNDRDKKTVAGYHVEVRWNRQPRLFHDRYFDTKDAILEKNHHTFRHRRRLKMIDSSAKAWSGKLSKVVNEDYLPEWDRIQYKSTPTRIGPVWFRREVGECLIWNQDANRLDSEDGSAEYCKGITPSLNAADSVITELTPGHPAVSQLMKDHPHVTKGSFKNTVDIQDWRYRIVFQREASKGKFETMYEMSIDGLIMSDLTTGDSATRYEVEMEIIQESSTYSDSAIDNLMDLCRTIETDLFQDELKLAVKHSEFSKSGVR